MYQLTPDDLDNSRDDEPPAIRAAQNPNPAVLQALLDHSTSLSTKTVSRYSANASISGAITGLYETPLTAAIRARLPENIHTLLAAGADPNGISAVELSDYATRFIRGRDPRIDTSSFAHCAPRAVVLAAAVAKGIVSQTAPLTDAEIEERGAGFVRFWTEPNVPAQRLRMTPALTALEVAAAVGDVGIFEMVRAAGADESAWLERQSQSEGGEKVSALSTSSPVHQAIHAGRTEMLRHLLRQGYSPNYLPSAAPTLALPPVSYAIAQCDLENAGVQECLVELLQDPRLDIGLRTPIFDIHVIHFATARHDPALLRWLAASVPGGMRAAGTTALHQTLLHIACLPLTAEGIVARNPAVARSLHCARTLDVTWLPHRLPSPLHMQFAGPGELGTGVPRPMTGREQRALRETVRVILEAGVDVRVQDVDGNTALHYLAGTLNVDEETVEMVKAEGGMVWEEAKNHAGFTPRELWGE